MGSAILPNTLDGSIQADYVVLLMLQGHAASTLGPIAPMGVIYPQGTAVWLASGVALYDWPIATTPVLLPPLFAALSVVGGFAWGSRLFGVQSTRGLTAGLVFAGSMTVLNTWPRFLVGGSYDFLFAIPLFLVLMGWISDKRTAVPLSWRSALLLASGVGVMASVSPVPAAYLVLMIVGGELICPRESLRKRLTVTSRALIVGVVAALFDLPSFVGIARWWSFPAHVLTPIGGDLAPASAPANPVGSFLGLVDPFLFRSQDVWLSPFPILKVELAVLLVTGLGLLAFSSASHSLGTTTGLRVAGVDCLPRRISYETRGRARRAQLLPTHSVRHLWLGIGVGLLLLSLTTIEESSPSLLTLSTSFASAIEVSILLFIVYGCIATLPIAVAAEEIRQMVISPNERDKTTNPTINRTRRRMVRRLTFGASSRHSLQSSGLSPSLIVASVLIVVPMSSGALITATQSYGYLVHGIRDPLANVTTGDLDALAWVANHIPSCSGVLVAPGSAAEYLPSWNPNLRVIFPMDPAPVNLSYSIVVSDLSHGYLNKTTLSALASLQVTEIVATGQSNILWRPFQTPELYGSQSFQLLFRDQDASVFGFLPDIASMGCFPVAAGSPIAPSPPTVLPLAFQLDAPLG